MKVKKLNVTITYKVGFGNIEMPDKVYEQLMNAENSSHDIDSNSIRYPEAEEWLVENIKQRDCYDWNAEIQID